MIRTFAPEGALNKLVDYIWLVDFDFLAPCNREDLIMPLGHINIIFNYGSSYRLVGADRDIVIPNSVVIGQIRSAKRVRYGAHLHQLGVSLTPLGFVQLFDVPGVQLTERIVHATEVDPELHDVYRMIMNCQDIGRQIQAVNSFLLHKLASSKKNCGRIEKMLAYVEREFEDLNIAHMAAFFGLSVSSLERFFKKHVGLPPKLYGNIIKFREHAENHELRKGRQHRYYDQSHLIKTSKKLAGKTIGELAKLPSEITLGYVWHGQSK